MLTVVSEEMRPRAGARRSPLVWLTIVILIAAVAVAVAVREKRPVQTHDIVASVHTPDNRMTAVLYELSGDAKTPFFYQVELTAAGHTQTIAELTGAMRNDRAYGVNLVWTGNDHLDIQYLKAQDQKLLASTMTIENRQVKVTLHSGVRDDSAQPGGMLFSERQ